MAFKIGDKVSGFFGDTHIVEAIYGDHITVSGKNLLAINFRLVEAA